MIYVLQIWLCQVIKKIFEYFQRNFYGRKKFIFNEATIFGEKFFRVLDPIRPS